ncbi:MAG: amidohydrolase family protein [Gemmatimonadales bacterium]
MNRPFALSALASGLLAAPLVAQAPAARAPAYAITNATIVPVAGPRITGGTIVIRGDRIEAVGAGVTPPAGAQVIDGRGLFVYPGLIDLGARLGLVEIGSVPGGQDLQEVGQFHPHNNALTAVNPHSEHFPITRVNGVTSLLTSADGGVIRGSAALIDLAGWTPDEMAVLPRAAMSMTYPRVAGGRFRGRGGAGQGEAADQTNRQVQELTAYLREAKAYTAVATHEKANLPYTALAEVVRGTMPVIFDVQTESQIRGVLALADSFGLKVVLRGATEAFYLADTLAARKIPVIVGPMTRTPERDLPYDAVYATPGVLARAGVTIAFQSDDGGEGSSRNLPYHAALATAYGLDPEEALKALTINAARILGVESRLGSLETGKTANLFVTTGDPLDVRTQVKHVFIRGQLMPWNDRHTKLYEQFRARPRP